MGTEHKRRTALQYEACIRPDAPAIDQTQALLKEWTDEPVLSVESPVLGTMNDVRIVATRCGRYVLRIYRKRDEQRLVREHAVVNWLYQQGIPTVPPIALPGGKTYVWSDGRLVTLLPFVEGVQLSRERLDARQISAMGVFLGTLHTMLARCPVPGIPALSVTIDSTRALATIDAITEQIRATDDKTTTDHQSLRRLATRRVWIEQHPEHRSFTTDSTGAQPVHGDFQESNVLFRNGSVSAVLDWERIYRAPPAWEVVRCLDLMLAFSPRSSRAFLRGYRSERDLTLAELDEAASLYGLMRAYDLWLFEEIYTAGNHRVRKFVKPGPFVPIQTRWDALRRELAAT